MYECTLAKSLVPVSAQSMHGMAPLGNRMRFHLLPVGTVVLTGPAAQAMLLC
jgi:hypothetical protein